MLLFFRQVDIGPTLMSHYMCLSMDTCSGGGALEIHCESGCSVGSVACVKSLEMFNFWGSGGQSDCALTQIHYCDAIWTLSNEIAFVIQPGKTRECVKKPAGQREFKKRKRELSSFTRTGTTLSLRLRDPFCNNNNKKQEKAGKAAFKRGSSGFWTSDLISK